MDAISIMIQRERMPDTGAYDTLKSTPSMIDYPSAHVLEYILYLLSMSVFLTVNYILGWIIFVSSGNEVSKNSALNLVDFTIFSSFQNIESHQSDIILLLTMSPIWSGVRVFVGRIIILSCIS